MPPFFDARVAEALALVESSADAAAQALLLAAEYLRSGQRMPDELAAHLAGAFEASMGKAKGPREKALLQELGLTAPNARPKGDYFLVGQLVEQGIRAGKSLAIAVNDAMADPRVSIESPSTIKRLHQRYLAAKAEHDGTL